MIMAKRTRDTITLTPADYRRAKAKAKPTKTAPPASPLATFLARWQAGEQLSVLATESGMKRSAFRRQLTKLLGGKSAFKAARAQGAGGTHRATPPRRDSGTRQIEDSDTPMVLDTSIHAGWSWRRVWEPAGIHVKEVGAIQWRRLRHLIHIAPDGTEYVEAKASEKADLLAIPTVRDGSGVTRLRVFATSAAARDLKQHEALIARGQARHDAVRAEKRAKRAARAPKRGALTKHRRTR